MKKILFLIPVAMILIGSIMGCGCGGGGDLSGTRVITKLDNSMMMGMSEGEMSAMTIFNDPVIDAVVFGRCEMFAYSYDGANYSSPAGQEPVMYWSDFAPDGVGEVPWNDYNWARFPFYDGNLDGEPEYEEWFNNGADTWDSEWVGNYTMRNREIVEVDSYGGTRFAEGYLTGMQGVVFDPQGVIEENVIGNQFPDRIDIFYISVRRYGILHNGTWFSNFKKTRLGPSANWDGFDGWIDPDDPGSHYWENVPEVDPSDNHNCDLDYNETPFLDWDVVFINQDIIPETCVFKVNDAKLFYANGVDSIPPSNAYPDLGTLVQITAGTDYTAEAMKVFEQVCLPYDYVVFIPIDVEAAGLDDITGMDIVITAHVQNAVNAIDDFNMYVSFADSTGLGHAPIDFTIETAVPEENPQ